MVFGAWSSVSNLTSAVITGDTHTKGNRKGSYMLQLHYGFTDSKILTAFPLIPEQPTETEILSHHHL